MALRCNVTQKSFRYYNCVKMWCIKCINCCFSRWRCFCKSDFTILCIGRFLTLFVCWESGTPIFCSANGFGTILRSLMLRVLTESSTHFCRQVIAGLTTKKANRKSLEEEKEEEQAAIENWCHQLLLPKKKSFWYHKRGKGRPRKPFPPTLLCRSSPFSTSLRWRNRGSAVLCTP